MSPTPEGYENRKVGNRWAGFHRSLPLALRLFNRRWAKVAGPWEHTKPDGGWSGPKTRAENRRAIATLMSTNPEIGFRVRVRGSVPSAAEYVLRRFFRSVGNVVLDFALSQLGVLYVWGAEDPKPGPAAFDCSGFTKWCLAQVGIELPHNAELQRLMTVPCSWADARPGELVFYGEGGAPYGPAGHVGIKFDDTRIIDTASARHPVAVRSVLGPWTDKMPFVCGYIPGVTRAA